MFYEEVNRVMQARGCSFDDACSICRITNKALANEMDLEARAKESRALANEAAASERKRIERLWNDGIQERRQEIKRLVDAKMAKGADYDLAFRLVKLENEELFPS